MTNFVQSNQAFFVDDTTPENRHESLPPGNYMIQKNPNTGALFFVQMESFTLPTKMYGNISSRADRILNTFYDRPNTTGVLLSGEKGSGKTQLARVISARAKEQGIPTIVINAPWCGEGFNKLMQSITQPVIVFMDEFEKVYDSEDQESVLTLLDGTVTGKKMFIFTVNDKWRINAHMRNRPGRIFYLIEFGGLSHEFIVEYCKDNLNDQSQLDSVTRVAMLFEEFNFDMLKALVEDMNRYNESAIQVLELLNAKPDTRSGAEHDVELFIEGVKVEIYQDSWDNSPLATHQQSFHLTQVSKPKIKSATPTNTAVDGIGYIGLDEPEDDAEDDEIKHEFMLGDMKEIDPARGVYVFVNKEGARAVFTRAARREFSYRDSLAF